MKASCAYIDLNGDCSSGVPKIDNEELENPLVILADIGKNLAVLQFEPKDTSKYLSVNDFVDSLVRNTDIIIGDGTSFPLLTEDFDVLYSKETGFINLPWTEDRIKDKCKKIKSQIVDDIESAFKFKKNGVALYNIDGLPYRYSFSEAVYENEVMDKAAVFYHAQQFLPEKIKDKCIISIQYDDIDNAFDMYMTIKDRNYLDVVNGIKEMYKESMDEEIFVKTNTLDDFSGKNFMTITKIDDDFLLNFSIPTKDFSTFTGFVIHNLDNPELKVAEDILEGLSTFKNDNIEVFETSDSIGISDKLILSVIKEREDLPKVIMVYNIDDDKDIFKATIAVCRDNHNFEICEGEIPIEEKNDFTCRYVDYADGLRKIEIERKDLENDSKKDIELD